MAESDPKKVSPATPAEAPKASAAATSAVVPADKAIAAAAPKAVAPQVKAEPVAAATKISTPAAMAKVKKAARKKAAVKKAPLVKAPVAAKALPKPSVPTAARAAAPIIKTAKAAVARAAKPAVKTVQKEMFNMATAFETPKVFNDFNDRAKVAVEKSTKLAQEMGEFSKGNVEAIVESGRIAAKGFEALGQDAADYGRKSFEGLTATLKSLSSVKSPADFFKLQSDYLRASFDSAVAQSSKNTEAMIKLAGDAAQPLSSRFALAAEKVKAAA